MTSDERHAAIPSRPIILLDRHRGTQALRWRDPASRSTRQCRSTREGL